MIATIPYIKSKFEEYNKLMFSCTLPMPTIELSDAKSYVGLFVCRKRRMDNGETMPYDFRLRISKCIDMPEEELQDTIIHEMIHYCIAFNRLEDSSKHGIIFRSMMANFNSRFGRHISISHKTTSEQREQGYDTRRRWHVVAMMALSDGSYGVKVLPRIIPRVVNYYNKVGLSPLIDRIDLYMCDDPYFNRFPNSSALKVYTVNRDEAMAHLKDAIPMQCDGKTVTMDTE